MYVNLLYLTLVEVGWKALYAFNNSFASQHYLHCSALKNSAFKLLFVRKWLYLYTVLKTAWHHFFILFLGGGERGNYKKHVHWAVQMCFVCSNLNSWIPLLSWTYKIWKPFVWWVTTSHERNKIPCYITDLRYFRYLGILFICHTITIITKRCQKKKKEGRDGEEA